MFQKHELPLNPSVGSESYLIDILLGIQFVSLFSSCYCLGIM